MEVLRMENVSISYGETSVVKNINFQLQRGEIISIVGESGSGKSTILNAIIGFLPEEGRIQSGEIYYEGKKITRLSQKEWRLLRGKKIGTIFQEPGSTLNPFQKIGKQFFESYRHVLGLPQKEAKDLMESMFSKVGLKNTEELIEKFSFQLSGGMNQRVSIALATSLGPNLLLADEPTSSLDATIQKNIIEEFLFLKKEFNMSILLVTHNLALAKYISDKILVLFQGNIVDFGTPEEILQSPKSKYTQTLLADIPKIKE